MNEQRFTPGPWDYMHRKNREGMFSTEVFCSKGETIATFAWYPTPTVGGVTGTYREGNARLVAAAPDLLAVAQFFLRGIEGGHIKCAPYIDFDPDAEQLEIKSPAERLRAAIARATTHGAPHEA